MHLDRALSKEPPTRRQGPGARHRARAERRAAEIVRGYARSLIGMLAEEFDRVEPGAPDQRRQVRAAVRRARARMRRQWTARDIAEILAALIAEGRKAAGPAARASISQWRAQTRGDAARGKGPSPSEMRRRAEMPERESWTEADEIIARLRLTGTGYGRKALADLQARAAEWAADEAEIANDAREMSVGFDRAISKILGRADLIGSEEANAASAEAIRAALSRTTSGYYRWRSQEDNRVRDTQESSHVAANREIYSWEEGSPHTNPPGLHPGEEINCRCWAEPVSASDLQSAGLVSDDTTTG